MPKETNEFTEGRSAIVEPEFFEVLNKYPELKEAALKMQTAIKNSVFSDIFYVHVSVGSSSILIHRAHESTIRMLNRIKAYSERYEELRPHLKSISFIPSEE